jgi:DNA-binding transcriptional regulator of glucitol operon
LSVIAAALTCLALGWWQWTRFREGGTFQNLGYALQWPLFAVSFVYAYRRFVRLEDEHDPSPTPETQPRTLREQPLTAIPQDLLPPRAIVTIDEPVDPVLAEYNRYLADLHAADQRMS